MPAPLNGEALGLIETQGYTALIVATDAAVKAGNVDVRSLERATGGLVLITLVGDVASVQVAVQAGAQAAASVGNLVSSHVIARPDAEVWRIFRPGRKPRASDEKSRRAVTTASEETATPVIDEDLDALPVRELRRRARAMQGFPLSGREISRAIKKDLVAAIRRLTDAG